MNGANTCTPYLQTKSILIFSKQDIFIGVELTCFSNGLKISRRFTFIYLKANYKLWHSIRHCNFMNISSLCFEFLACTQILRNVEQLYQFYKKRLPQCSWRKSTFMIIAMIILSGNFMGNICINLFSNVGLASGLFV